jgi:hypothetical protein
MMSSPTNTMSPEEDDARIFREGRCYICLDVVPKTWTNDGRREYAVWKVSAQQHLILHPACAPRAAAHITRRPVREILPILRAMRPGVQR